jgi:uncharacterized membrane protein
VSRLPRQYDADLAIAAGLALVGLVVTVAPFPDPIRAVLFLPLVLVLPGLLLAAVLFPPGFVTGVERVVLLFAFTVCAWAICGLLIQVAIGLDRTVWLVLLLVLTLMAVPVAQARRRPGERPLPWWPRAPKLEFRALAAILVAIGGSALAVAVASSGASNQLDRSHFSAVWIVPSPAGRVTSGEAVTVGAENHEGHRIEYRLRVSRAGRTLRQWRFSLGDHAHWQAGLTVPVVGRELPVVAALFRGGTLYRRTALKPEALP